MRTRSRPGRPATALLAAALLVGMPLAATSPPRPAHGDAALEVTRLAAREPAAPPESVPSLVDDRVVAVPLPTAVATAPGGLVLVTGKAGELVAVRPDGSHVEAGSFVGRLCTDREQGLLGVEVDPDFAANRRVYLFMTVKAGGDCRTEPGHWRVVRVVLGPQDRLRPESEKVLLDDVVVPPGGHTGGDLRFGRDGTLYVSIGDGTCDREAPTRCQGENGNARRLDIPQGKILRIRPDGSVPAGNPFVGVPGARRCAAPGGPEPGDGPCAETYGWGLRNPYRIAADRASDRIFVNDVGLDTWEEVDRLRKGADYGWNRREGPCPQGQRRPCRPAPDRMTDPIHAYTHDGGCESITGGDFVPGRAWGATLEGAYLFADFVCGRLFALPAGQPAFVVRGGFGAKSIVSMRFGHGSRSNTLYYTTFAGGGQLRRLRPG